ncbi:hypothetical protein W97_02749 [Coniosporium apollinis CBS 100218]|uniref:Thioredoxin domain-containing protein n=1 Tax=Coniosporium apollinis (strain CBS 100218) TaxID=1168221 RepID=R7YPD0_CONA1|nr:uncharacterized protein W97_02749 [Coniosporium apollinis CBS 100218]EON63521.1 hypothetical protein W97_02749 [Coniosporium apollinis CBS 100218]
MPFLPVRRKASTPTTSSSMISSPIVSSATSSPTDPVPSRSSSGHSSHPSDATQSTVPTASSVHRAQASIKSVPSIAPSTSACTLDPEDWFSRFRGDLDISDELPSKKTLREAAGIPIFAADGTSRAFGSLYEGDNVIGERQLVLFVRHFYCGACQAYLRALTKSITLQTYFTMSIPTSIIIIGCGSPNLIPHYKAQTGCPFPIFADPSRKLYKVLGMSWTLDMGPRADYMVDREGKEINELKWVSGQIKDWAVVGAGKGTPLPDPASMSRPQSRHKALTDAEREAEEARAKAEKKKKLARRNMFKGGNMLQIGGEFLFRDGEVEWCHRMKNYRGHADIQVLRRVLEIDDDDDKEMND